MIRNISTLALLIVSLALYVYYQQVSSQKKVDVRRFPAIDAIEEGIGRAVEMGRPVHFTTGSSGDLSGSNAPPQMAGITALDYVAKMSSERGAKLIASICKPDVYVVADATAREAYVSTGHITDYQEDTVRFLGGSQFGYASAVMGTFQRETPACNIMIGAFAASSLIFAETASKVGAFQIAGTQNPSQIPFFVVASDYALIGEEIYALDAYLSKTPELVNSLGSEDIIKLVIAIFSLIGAITASMGSSFIINWLGG
jgi:hypothetical protein